MVMKAKHGGIYQVSTRYARAVNSKSKAIRNYFKDPDFDEQNPTVSLYYLDCNQLYPSAMLYKLPVGSFEIIPVAGKDKDRLLGLDEKENIGYIPKENMAKRAQGEFGYYIEFSWYYPEKRDILEFTK